MPTKIGRIACHKPRSHLLSRFAGDSDSAGAEDENNVPELFHSQIIFDSCKKRIGRSVFIFYFKVRCAITLKNVAINYANQEI